MFDYLVVAFHWYLGAWPDFTNSVFSHKGHDWPSYWVLVCIFAVASMMFVGMASEGEGFLWWVRGSVLAVLLVMLWPWILLSLLPIAVLAVLGTIVYAYVDLIPSKEERITRTELKRADTKAAISEVKNGF